MYRDIAQIDRPECTVYFADDSLIARRQIERTLDAMGVRYVASVNGRQAWDELDKAARIAAADGCAAHERISLVLTDIEMPEMDGYILTKKIKGDPRLAGIPVIMHSSLSGDANQSLGLSVGVDEYVSKFEPQKLAEALARRIGVHAPAAV
jgi:two-component system chemotaxis response regulator CheV